MKRFLPRFQFSLRTLFVAITIFCLWFGWQARRARQQELAVNTIDHYGYVYYDGIIDGANTLEELKRLESPPWYKRGFVKHFFSSVTTVSISSDESNATSLAFLKGLPTNQKLFLRGKGIGNRAMPNLRHQPNLTELQLWQTNVTDDGLVHLSNLHKLEVLNLYDSKITGTGLAHLSELPNLRELNVSWSQLNDVGARSLRGLKHLENLNMSMCDNITDKSLVHLQEMSHLTDLDLNGSFEITGEGFVHWKQLKSLRRLDLSHSGVRNADYHEIKNAGLRHLKNLVGLQYLNLSGTSIFDEDIYHLGGMKSLKELDLTGTFGVTRKGVMQLQAKLPGCKIKHDTPSK